MKTVSTSISRPYFNVNITYRENNEDDEAVIREMFVENVYQLEGYKLEQERPIILDIGANIGVFTLQVLKLAQENNKAVTIYAVEPEENNLELLKKNLADNPRLFDDGSEVIIIESAVSDFNGEMGITNDAGGSKLDNDESLQKVSVVTYNDMIKELELDKIDFTKIDIEGSEVGLVSAANADLLKKSHYYAIECDQFNDKNDFIKILTPFLNDFSFYTWGIPRQGCNLYLENHHWGNNG